ncbi:hypothetical protein VTN77DRAFT_3104 [Rasamsonia byssochlamydoides]|uniref:uncharacterized protein n=1 Tax=Rasamsonia byssochlamydoides TaxID=89139 RepID=UPI0037437D18
MASKSPVSATSHSHSQRKGSSAPETETPGAIPTTSPRTVPPFPSPQIFDFLPPLHALLQRLLSSAAAAATASTTAPEPAGDAAGAAAASSGPTQAQQQQQQSQQAQSQQVTKAPQQPAPTTSSAASATADTTLLGPNALPPLDIKDLPTAASAVKIRIQKARAVIDSLPDVSRTVEEQEQEIAELEERIGRLRAVIAEFGRRAGMELNEKMEMGP